MATEKDTREVKICLGLCLMTPDKAFIRCLLPILYTDYLYGHSVIQGTLLPYARNSVIRSFYKHQPDFTHVLFIDDDMSTFGIQHIQKLLDDDKPIVSALICLRAAPYDLVIGFDDNSPQAILDHVDNHRIVESTHVGMAFTLIKREVLDALVEETPQGPIWFNMDRPPREGFGEEVEKFIEEETSITKACTSFNLRPIIEEAILLGQTSHITSNVHGEDVSFCNRAAQLGFKSYVDCGVSVGHVGTVEYDYRYSFENTVQEHNEQSVEQISEQPELKIVTP